MNRRCPRLRRVALPLWLTLAAAARPADAGPNLTPYPSFRALRPAGAEAARSIGRCELDEELLAATDDAYANLRVVDDRDTEIPFLARTARHTRSVTNDVDLAARTLSLRTLADNRIEVLLEVTHPETAPAALVLYSDQKDFEKHVSVYGSDDRANWQPLALRQPVFDYSRFMDVRHTRVELPGKAFRWFKLDIANISETNQSPLIQISRDWRDGRVFSAVEQSAFRRADFRIERVQFLERRVAEIKAEPIRRAYTVRDLRVEHKPREQQTVATFATDRPPLTALELAVDTPNFSRAVRLEGTNDEGDKAAWRPLAAGAVQRIAVGAFQRRQTRLELGRPCRFRRYRLTIDNLDSPPLALTAIAGWRRAGRTLYNGFLSGLSLDGQRYFYVNPLLSRGGIERTE